MSENLLYNTAIQVSLHRPLSYLRQIAVDASPDEAGLLGVQRRLLRSATARLRRKGLSTDTETYRRLGILVPPWRYPVAFEQTLHALRDYWRRHRTATTLGRAAPYRQARDRAGEYLRMLADFGEEEEDDDDDESASARYAHLLPTPTDMRVFRLVNGNLEIPPTLLKALASAGRIEDAFFPDEPATWQDLASRAAGAEDGEDGDDGDEEDGDNGDNGDNDDNSDEADNDNNDVVSPNLLDDGSLFVDPYPLAADDVDTSELVSPAVARRVRQATAQFLRQLQQGSGSSALTSPSSTSRLLDLYRGHGHGHGHGHGTAPGIPPIIVCPLPILLPVAMTSRASMTSMASMASMTSIAAMAAMSPVVVPADAVNMSAFLSKLGVGTPGSTTAGSTTSSSRALPALTSRSRSRTPLPSASSSSSTSSTSSRKRSLPSTEARPNKKHKSHSWLSFGSD